MWKMIKRFYWRQRLIGLNIDMMIFAISYNYYVAEGDRIQAKIDELS